ncbi:adhesin [Spiroplasma sp. Moj]|uniref:adhesin n=1 Tax=Spiroplasma sp. Moj TaxID=1922342 RepID=UPI0039F0891C|nr:adhesin [Spiroplasma sp. Moj]
MKKLLSLLSISTLTASVPAPLLANTVQTRTKRDVAATSKDVTTGFNIKIKQKEDDWKLVDIAWKKDWIKFENEFKNWNNKWYFFIEADTYGFNKYLAKNNGNINQVNDSWLWGIMTNNFQFAYLDASKIKYIYIWNDNNVPPEPEINKNTGEIIDWKLKTTDNSLFQQGISFSLAENDKTATWSNAGMRLTVDGETNININNSNVMKVYWNGVKQNMLDHKVNINVKPETSEKTHKLVIKYDINGTKYTSENIDVVMAAKIEPPNPIVKENLSDLIKTTDLGNILDKNDDTIFAVVNQKNSNVIDDFSQIEITAKTDTQATLKARYGSKSYAGSVDVKYNISSATIVDLKIELKKIAGTNNPVSDYLVQLDSSKMTNRVDTFYYANGKSTIKIKQPATGNDITGKIYGCDEQWNKISQSSTIDPVSGLEIDKGQYGSVDGRYLIELQHQDLPTHTKTIYLQINNYKTKKEYWNTPNGKQFEIWAEDNGYKNIRGSSASQLNNLFELSKTWKQSLAHLDLKLDNFVVDNIKNVSQDEIDNYKTKLLAGVKEQVEKYGRDVVENIDYVISVDNLVAGDWTTSKDVKVQSVDGSTKLLSLTTKTIPVQQKEQPTPPAPPTPDNNKKLGLTGWAIVGIVVGSLAGLALLGWLFKRFVVDPFILKPIREKKEKAFVAKTEKDIAQMKKDDEEWEAKQRGDK